MRAPFLRTWLSAALCLLILLLAGGHPVAGPWPSPAQLRGEAASTGGHGMSGLHGGAILPDTVATLSAGPRVVTKSMPDMDTGAGLPPAPQDVVQPPRFARALPPATAPSSPKRPAHPGSPRGPPGVA